MSVTAVPLQPTRRATLVLLWLGIVIAIVAAGLLAWKGTAAFMPDENGTTDQYLAYVGSQPGVQKTADGLLYKVLSPGAGTEHPTDDDVSLINYKGTLRDGKVFDQSQRPTPLPVSGSIKGFSEGLKLMVKGAKYRFWIKPDLAYGEKSPDPSVIPNNAPLVFDVELIDFLPQSVLQQQMQMQQMMQAQGQGGAGAPGGTGQ